MFIMFCLFEITHLIKLFKETLNLFRIIQPAFPGLGLYLCVPRIVLEMVISGNLQLTLVGTMVIIRNHRFWSKGNSNLEP